ncbi:MAG: DUF4998 domain-containing protein [Tannerella sp.]|jgi:hypothetical protein|nr:DUF4998 domain-containing protein [Tannerella sp.]
MKNVKMLIFSIGLLPALFACSKMEDVHKAYIHEGGEIFYLTAPDSIAILPDKYSALVRLWTYNAPNVKMVKIYWDNGQDSLIVPVSFHTGKDSVDILIPGLREKTYSFTITMADNFGSSSIPVENISCNVVGDIWLNSLASRSIRRVSNFVNNPVVIYWNNDVSEEVLYSEVIYENTNGDTTILQVPNNEQTTIIPDAKVCMRVLYRSVYAPLATSAVEKEPVRFDPGWDNMSMVGDPTGWWDGYHTTSNNYVYVFDIANLTAGNFRFNYQNASHYYGRTDWLVVIAPPEVGAEVVDGKTYPILQWFGDEPEFDIALHGGGEFKWHLSTAGHYRITIDMNEMWAKFEKVN